MHISTRFIFNKKSGIHYGIGSNHDFAGCIVKDGKILRAIEAERLNKIKHSVGAFNPFNSVTKYLFPKRNTSIKNVACCDTLNPSFYHALGSNVKVYNHHRTHAAAVFYTSPFTTSAIFVADGVGSYFQKPNGSYQFETYSYFLGNNTHIKLLKQVTGEVGPELDETHEYRIEVPNSLGLFYSYITRIVGFKFLEDGKTMGLSAYGSQTRYYRIMKKYVSFCDRGVVTINFGQNELAFFKSEIAKQNPQKQFQCKADIAAAGQRLFEEMYYYCLNYLHTITKTDNLCLCGGTALNSVANGKIKSRTPFKNIYAFPACGDSSTAVGAALLSFYESSSGKRIYTNPQSPFPGRIYSAARILQALKKYSVPYTTPRNIYTETATLIDQGKVVAWFQGGSEIGPRALGHRSIIADPRRSGMRKYMNEKIKFREDFRPFAPSVLETHLDEYFESAYPTPYMLDVFRTKKTKIKEVPAVIHVDGTARVQTVNKNNPAFFKLLTAFYNRTGVPMVLNTSFNVKGQPIVETPEDAIECFLSSKIDRMAIGRYLCRRPSRVATARTEMRQVRRHHQNRFGV